MTSPVNTATAGLKAITTSVNLSAGLISSATDPNVSDKIAIMEQDSSGSIFVKKVVSTLNQDVLEAVRVAEATYEESSIEGALYSRMRERVASREHSIADKWGSVLLQMDNFIKSASTKGTAVESLVSALSDFTDRVNTDAARIQLMRNEAEQGMSSVVTEFNQKLTELHELNQRFSALRSSSQEEQLIIEDQREKIITEMRALMDFNIDISYKKQTGSILIKAPDGSVLLDHEVHPLSFTPSPQKITADMRHGSGLNGITTEDGKDITTAISSGRVKGYIDIRDTIGTGASDDLDALAMAIYNQFNKVANTGSPYPPPTALTGTSSYNEADSVTISGDVYLHLTDSNGKLISRHQITAGAKTMAELRDEITAFDADLTATLSGDPGTLSITAANSKHLVIGGEGTIRLTAEAADTATNFSHFMGFHNIFEFDTSIVSSTSAQGFASAVRVPASLSGSTFPYSSVNVAATVGNPVIAVGNFDVAISLLKEMGDDGTAISIGANSVTLKKHIVDFLGTLTVNDKTYMNRMEEKQAIYKATYEQHLSQHGISIEDKMTEISHLMEVKQQLATLIRRLTDSNNKILDIILS